MASFPLLLVAIMALVLPAISSLSSHSSPIATVSIPSIASTITATITVSPIPAPSDALSVNDTSAAARLHFQPIYNIDYPRQDIFPWIWARSYEECLLRCDTYNANNMGNGTIFCKAALFAPSRINGLNDCYLKKSLDNPQSANVTLIGGIKLDCNHSASSFASSGSTSMASNGTLTSTSTTFETSTIATKSASSYRATNTGRPSITFGFDPTLDPTLATSTPQTSMPPLPHVSTVSDLSPSSSSPIEVLTLPTATHDHHVL